MWSLEVHSAKHQRSAHMSLVPAEIIFSCYLLSTLQAGCSKERKTFLNGQHDTMMPQVWPQLVACQMQQQHLGEEYFRRRLT